jgi:hypothetical protein
LAQAYGLASFFAPQNLEMHRCDKATGKIMPPTFLFPDLGAIAPDADEAERHRAVAQMVTRPKNPRFAKTIVNRFWKRLLERGLFEPVDDFDSNPQHSMLLEWLAYDFMSHDYDAKHTLRQILLSQVYQLPVTRPGPAKPKEAPVLVGPVERRLTSEQYLDAIAEVTDYWPKADVMKVAVSNPHIRAWRYKKPDALATALGRPNREQVCTERNRESTVLQALELANGTVLSMRLQEGAKVLLASDLGREQDTSKIIDTLYLRALGRPADAGETALLQPLLGSAKDPVEGRHSGWQDFLWILFLSPEFQFVR